MRDPTARVGAQATKPLELTHFPYYPSLFDPYVRLALICPRTECDQDGMPIAIQSFTFKGLTDPSPRTGPLSRRYILRPRTTVSPLDDQCRSRSTQRVLSQAHIIRKRKAIYYALYMPLNIVVAL